MSKPDDDKMENPLYMIGRGADGVSLLLVGMPETAFNPAGNGWTFDFDLTPHGLPLKLGIFKAKDREDCMKIIKELAAATNTPLLDSRRKN